jgi:phosphatidylglycerophosphatase A
MRNALVRFFATGFGIGRLPFAPGTAGSILGVVYWWSLTFLQPWAHWLVFVLAVVFAVWCAGEAAELFRKPDPPQVVIDEIVVMPLALAAVGMEWWKIAIGFIWFRVFDIWKPPPVRQAQAFSGGVGIVLDDLLAAAYACLATHAVLWIISHAKH